MPGGTPATSSRLDGGPEATLQRAIHDINEVVASVSTVLSGDKLILTREKLIYEKRPGLRAVSIDTIRVSDILNVTGSIGPFFGTIRFKLATPEFPGQVGLLWRRDAIRMKRIINGYVLALSRNIDTAAIPMDKLLPALVELGTDDSSIVH